ncbi:MAG: o-succinylbenzoate synthase [Chroococcidiopsidaceae cyanobacterium CP_BM_ER_R8_30]|nr:o-succinylbenzoate synthase [Chroococcidiopsidaceae cyanobacterium CP_BM_ER_R8_30]
MRYQFEFRPYRRQFKHPLQTSHGTWTVREGIILRLSDEGRVGWGEIAPISWFGSETLEQALNFCHQLPTEITRETIFSIPSTLPACQFGFESAWEEMEKRAGEAGEAGGEKRRIRSCGLLSAGEAALEQWESLWNRGYRTLKWKIGVAPLRVELEIFHRLVQSLPASAQLRLDANGGLSLEEAHKWLGVCDRLAQAESLTLLEFLEQPLPVTQFDAMLELNECYLTQLALDESVATLEQLESSYYQGWRGIFVIKPCIAGSPLRLRQFCHKHKIDAVFSSGFETAIGREAALQLATELSIYGRAVGFGTDCWFDEYETPELLWNNL